MALQVGRVGRNRSSTSASRGLRGDEHESRTAELVRQLRFHEDGSEGEQIPQLVDSAVELRALIAEDVSSRDVFRRGKGFEAVLALFRSLPISFDSDGLQDVLKLVDQLLLLVADGMRDHRGNRRYFSQRCEGWQLIEHAFSAFGKSCLLKAEANGSEKNSSALFGSLLRLAVDDESFAPTFDGPQAVEDGDDEAIGIKGSAAGSTTFEHPQAAKIAVHLALEMAGLSGEGSDNKLCAVAGNLLGKVCALTKSNTRNAFAIWQAGVMSDLLPIALEETSDLELRRAVSDLMSGLADFGPGTLDDVARLFRKARTSDEARTLLLAILRKSKGPAYVQFDMRRSGHSSIELPSLPRVFPPSSGYTLTTWLRIDEYDPNCHTTLFGAFDASQSCFLLIYLEKDSHQLILQTSIRSSKPSVRFRSTRLSAGRWYHIALVHRKATDARQSTAVLFIDGEFVEQVKCAYPESPPSFEEKDASPSPAGVRRSKPVEAFFGTPHGLAFKTGRDQVRSQWSLASAHLYATPLTDEFVSVHNKLGVRYCGNYQDCLGPLLTYRASAELNRYNELLHPDKSDKSDIVTATDGRGSEVVPEARLLLNISPVAVIDLDSADAKQDLDRKALSRYQQLSQKTTAIAVNAAIPTLNEAISRSCGTGILTGEPVLVIPKALDDASWRLAGCLPLVIGLLDSATTREGFLQATRIYFECMEDNWRISEEMEKSQGFGMLAMIIREKLGLETSWSVNTTRKPAQLLPLEDRQTLPLELLQLILKYVGYDSSRPDNSMIVNPMGYRVLLVDFDTWRRSDSRTQKLYYEQFMHFISHNRHQQFNTKRLVRMRVVRKLIEALKCEEIPEDAIEPLSKALRALLDDGSSATATGYKGGKAACMSSLSSMDGIRQGADVLEREEPTDAYPADLAMFIAFGLQDARAIASRPMRSIASTVMLRQRAASWARSARGSRPSTPGGALPEQRSPSGLPRAELAVHVMRLLTEIVCDESSTVPIKRFSRAVPSRWLLHLLAEADVRVIEMALMIISRSLSVLQTEFKSSFVDRNSGFITLKSRLKVHWRSPRIWLTCFSILLGWQLKPAADIQNPLTVFGLTEELNVGDGSIIANADILAALMAMLEAGLRAVVKESSEDDSTILKTIIQFLSELYSRSPAFREFATTSRFTQEVLFVLYPVLVGSDRLNAETELQAEKDTLSFKGEEVRMRPHSNSLGERPPSVRSLNIDDNRRTPSPLPTKNLEKPRRLSSFVMINPNGNAPKPAQFTSALAPKKAEHIDINAGNAIVESLLEVGIQLFIDLICNKKDFQGIGLFLKVPPGFREHQAYFESYVIVNNLSHLWNHLKLNQALFLESRVLTNLARYSQHLAEAVFEGWFIDGAQPVLEFTGQILEYLQQPEIAGNRLVKLCSQYVSNIRVVFLRVTLWRLSELDEAAEEAETVAFLDKMNYWQTILFASENQETLFLRLICFLLYLRLIASAKPVRLAATRLWRTILVQKPSTSATLLTTAFGADERHLSTRFMGLVGQDDEEFLDFIDENRASLDEGFLGSLGKAWKDFVDDEDKRNLETAQNRLSKRREKLRQWQAEEARVDALLHRYEVSTSHWRSNVHAQERVRLQRAIQDHSESVNHLYTAFARMARLVRQPCGLEPELTDVKWQLDETEAVNRMRVRLVRSEIHEQPKRRPSQRQPDKLVVNTQIAKAPEVASPLPASPMPPDETLYATADQQELEDDFEIIDEPAGAEVEDKNRKIMTSLQRHDAVQHLYNIARIIGLEACEGLLVVGKDCVYLQDDFFQRSDGEIVSVSNAPAEERDSYLQLISGKDVGTARSTPTLSERESRHWSWAELLSVSKRRFLFRDVAVEVFFTDGRSYLLTCGTPKVRDDLYNAMLARAPHVHSSSTVAAEDAWRLDTLRNPEEAPQSLGTRFATVFNNTPTYAATKKWVKGEMSNFQYLMLVNTMAMRTFNDLTQYPVFPWVLADYTSEELDLDDPKTFRDLSKPMGAQTSTREAEYRDRYQQFAEMASDAQAPPFHYGTHYSSAMIVSSYLIRLQPFVLSYLLLQGGNFDHADRLFDSIARAWLSASRDTMSDVRELTPEFFYLSEFLTNINGYDFGEKQAGGGRVNHVQLPPWAKGDPQIFIAKHREALESPYVSAHLAKWIDLTFGYKQRGEAAVDATNVFHYLSYHGAKDLDSINDPVERLATIGVIHSFGQTPHQVFQKPHPAREVNQSTSRLDTLAESLVRLPDPLFDSDEKVVGLTFSPTSGRLLCAGPSRLELLPNCDRFMQWGLADNSIRFFSSNTKRLLGLYENMHIGAITTAVFADSKTLVTAGADCTILVCTVRATRDWIEVQPKAGGCLFGHRTSVTHLAASRVFSTLLSASEDGEVILWGLNRLNCIRVILPAGSPAVQAAKVSNVNGHIVLCRGPNLLVYTLNGHLLVKQKVCDSDDDEMTCCAFYEGAGNEWVERELIFTGHAHGTANVWILTTLADGAWHLQLVKRLNHVDVSKEDGGNTSAAITAILPMPQAVYTGDETGRVFEWDCIQRQSSVSVRGK